MYEFEKAQIPDDQDKKIIFVEKLSKFGVSIQQYEKAYAMDNVTM